MRLTEQKFWDRMRNNLRGWPILIERIENIVGFGTPDTHTIGAGRAAWIELKATERLPARADTPVLGSEGLSVDQVNWHLNYAQFGGRSYVAIGIGSHVVLMLRGSMAAEINKMHLGDLAARAVAVSWEEIAQVLLGKEK